MTRDELCELVCDYAGPLGPFRSPEELDQTFERALEHATLQDFETLVEILCTPPLCAGTAQVVEGWPFALNRALTLAAASNRDAAIERLRGGLHVANARGVAISVLGALGAADVLIQLLHADHALDEADLIELADALGEVGAISSLQDMYAQYKDNPRICAEIETVLRHQQR